MNVRVNNGNDTWRTAGVKRKEKTIYGGIGAMQV
jgi:hypothetical protein